MKKFFKILLLIVFATNVSLLAQTTLTVTMGTATLDGVISPGEYTSTPLVTQVATLYAMDDGQNFYLAATWDDATESIAKKQWFYDGATWTQSENEDRFGIIFDMGLNDPDGASCVTMCHGDGLMRTNVGPVDVWHWKAYRSNPMGVADDKRWETDDRHSDPGTSSYSDNGPDASDLPEFMAISDPGANVDFIVEAASLGNFDPLSVMSSTFAEATAFNQGAVFSNGDVIPGYVLRTSDGDRGNVMAAGKWDNGVWTVEFKRTNSGSDYDFTVPGGGSVDFTHEIFDNTGGSHPNDGFDATVYTLDFSGITDVEDLTDQLPQRYALDQNYPNPFNPATTITYAVPQNSLVSLRVFDVLGKEVKTLVNEIKGAGTYTASFNAANVPSGIYFYKLEAGNFVTTKKMVLLK
ncbi:ethylbenzene dehydrogenase-related protein [Bacteroidota bacterium]